MKKNILLLDDEKLFLSFVTDLLEGYGYDVTACTSGSKIIELLCIDLEKYDLLITDYSMPEMNGLDLIKELRAMPASLPIILYSGYNDILSASELQEQEITCCLQKPINNAVLIKSVGEILS